METAKPKVKFEPCRAHQRYRLASGEIVPGASTIAKIGDDPGALLQWAWQCGCDGLDYRKVRDEAATAGTLAHWMIECHLKGQEPDLSEFAPSVVEKAESAYIKFLSWWDQNGFSVVASEVQLVSETCKFGGTLDIVALDRDGRHALIDIKTSSGIYASMWRQVAGYGQLWDEHAHDKISRYIICRIGRNADDGDQEFRERGLMSEHLAAFLAALELYRALKVAGK